MDLNTRLANARYEFIGRAEELADRAKQTRQNLADSGFPASSDHARQAKAEAERYEQDASIWRLRAQVAAEGFLLLDPSNPEWCLDPRYKELQAEAAKAKRVKFLAVDGAGKYQAVPVLRDAPPMRTIPW